MATPPSLSPDTPVLDGGKFRERLQQFGIGTRLSIGLEDPADLLADIAQAPAR